MWRAGLLGLAAGVVAGVLAGFLSVWLGPLGSESGDVAFDWRGAVIYTLFMSPTFALLFVFLMSRRLKAAKKTQRSPSS
ncbi:hypothetical protein GCM10022252_42570 [Streptosporangium oxazolinicum]|uniref:Major facilitator superfamily (MFS) profile domain-containing protein n=1 Tax=Streptosporangium oxazolinicum TaxID=909287 RepID=A0ABP8B1V3_9ACTN